MITGFPAVADISMQLRLMKEWCDRMFPVIQYTPLDKSKSIIDEVHDEVLSVERVYKSTVNLRAYAVPTEQAFPLTVFGIEQLRDVVLQASVPNLVESELATQDEATKLVTLIAQTGDRFIFNDYIYEVLVWKIGQTFGNTDIPLLYVASCEKVHRVATPYEGL